MAGQCGAREVVAVEVVPDLAAVATANAAANGLADKYTVLNTHSTELSELRTRSEPVQPTVIVGELLDTQLIGEGAIASMRHALSTFVVL